MNGLAVFDRWVDEKIGSKQEMTRGAFSVFNIGGPGSGPRLRTAEDLVNCEDELTAQLALYTTAYGPERGGTHFGLGGVAAGIVTALGCVQMYETTDEDRSRVNTALIAAVNHCRALQAVDKSTDGDAAVVEMLRLIEGPIKELMTTAEVDWPKHGGQHVMTMLTHLHRHQEGLSLERKTWYTLGYDTARMQWHLSQQRLNRAGTYQLPPLKAATMEIKGFAMILDTMRRSGPALPTEDPSDAESQMLKMIRASLLIFEERVKGTLPPLEGVVPSAGDVTYTSHNRA